MKSMKTENISLSAEEIRKQIDKKKKSIKQSDMEVPGGFQKSTEEEEKNIIEGKYKERIFMQEQLRSAEIGQQYVWAEADTLENIHKKYDTIKDKPKWYGIDMPKKVLVCEFNTKVQIWKQAMTKRNRYYDALKNVGFTKTELEPLLIDGKMISDNKILKKLEEDHNKKQLKKDDVDAV